MSSRFTFNWQSLLIGVGTLIVILVLAVFFWPGIGSFGEEQENSNSSGPVETSATPAATPEPEPANPIDIGKPVSITVNDMDVDASVLHLGFADDGSQAVPKTLHETGWWKLGSQPGQAGNGVIVGHATSSGKGVFNGLDGLEPGDKIVVKGETGTATFTVNRTDKKPKDDFAEVADDVYRTTGNPGLVLMTCGEWNGQVHEDIIFAYADLLAA